MAPHPSKTGFAFRIGMISQRFEHVIGSVRHIADEDHIAARFERELCTIDVIPRKSRTGHR